VYTGAAIRNIICGIIVIIIIKNNLNAPP